MGFIPAVGQSSRTRFNSEKPSPRFVGAGLGGWATACSFCSFSLAIFSNFALNFEASALYEYGTWASTLTVYGF